VLIYVNDIAEGLVPLYRNVSDDTFLFIQENRRSPRFL